MLSSLRAVAPRRLVSATGLSRCLHRLGSLSTPRQTAISLPARNFVPSYRTFATTRSLLQEAVQTQVETDGPSQPPAGPPTRFEELRGIGIDKRLVDIITKKLEYDRMTDVQTKTIPVCNSGIDVIARAKTGTGKTLAFLIPTINQLIQKGVKGQTVPQNFNGKKSFADVRALIISPTRELAEQISKDAILLTQGSGLKVATMVGGTGKAWALKDYHQRGCHILIGTPGRLADVLSDPLSGVQANKVETLIYDEADSLMSMGFEKETREINSHLPKDRQTLMFSATMPDKVRSLISENMRPGFKYVNTIDPQEAPTHTKVPQHMIQVEEYENMLPTLFELLHRENNKAREAGEHFKAMVFFSTARGAEQAAMMFRRIRLPNTDGHPLFPLDLIQIHSRLTQVRRTEAAAAFKAATNAVLFSSDVTARGMDFPNVSHVIQFGAPTNREQYIHRIGRTARGKNLESGRSVGYLILSDIDSSHALEHLKGLKFITDENDDLVSPKADLDDLDTLDEKAANFAKAIVLACGRLDRELLNKSYTSMIGSYLSIGAHPGRVVESLYRLTKYNFGYESAPAIGKNFAIKLGIPYSDMVRRGYLSHKDEEDTYGRNAGVTSPKDERVEECETVGTTG
ncbi:hypothetical protein ABW19_dt0208417 [Dactylella cylindrospora]|nr:hypothetical protein ABW19_dt0208417 [Dactylella cylindrospora]